MGSPAPEPSKRREPITLAVLNGADKGTVIRTGRTRITVGSAEDNDLVLHDSDVDPHHFSIVIDESGWRAQTASAKHQIVIDRRWSHPDSGRRGALIYAGGTEILLFPGELDDPTIHAEIQLRATADVTIPETAESGEVTRIASHPRSFDRDMHSLPPPAAESGDSTAPTIQLPRVKGGGEIDRVTLASLPTIAGAQIPREIQEAAQRGMRPEPTPRPVVQGPISDPAEASRQRSAWDRAIQPRNSVPPPAMKRPDSAPEVLAEPESKVRPVPSQAVLSSADGGGAWSPPTPARALVRVDDRKAGRNAWGDPRPSAPASGGRNAWGDAQERPMSGTPPSVPVAGRAWGDATGRSSRPAPPNPLVSQGRPSLAPGLEVAAHALALNTGEPGLELLHNPDGNFATAIRVFGTRLLDLARTYGYRAYMLTSAEPLTGKTTLATNLALALAEDPKRRVALIEANFRYPRLAQILGAPESHGLLGVLEGRMQVTEAILRFPDRNLVVFPSGGRHPHPGEVLASPRFKTLMAELASTVDVAIIDAPSVKPFADANLLLPLVDGALLVVLERSTKSAWIDQSLGQLGRERVLGALYNRLEKDSLKLLAKERRERLEHVMGG